MNSLAALLALGVVAVILFDLIASLASRFLGVPYVLATVGSFLIYAVIGFFVGRTATPVEAAVVCAAVGLTESTVGWYVSWIIGPGKPAEGELTRRQILTAIRNVTLLGAIIGGAAGVVAYTL